MGAGGRHQPALLETERWFLRHGLPYFVEEERQQVRRGLGRARLLRLVAVAVLLGAGIGVPLGVVARELSTGLAAGLWSAGLVVAGYAATTLRLRVIARWAVGRTLASLGTMFPLVTRALPLLMLFVTFLFINTEVWMVAASLEPGVLTLAVTFFAALAVGFLLVRLPEEMDRVDDDVDPGRLAARTVGTPVEGHAAGVFHGVERRQLAGLVEVAGLAKWNLVLVLLVAQAVQVLLLSLAVLVFFLGFGSVVMQPEVVAAWLGEDRLTDVWVPLLKVSVFLAGFSGLYFTVGAVTDETYRQQFFTSVTRELERAVAVRAVYRTLRAR
ncbi:MAG: hypothetical protein WB441_13850 [Nocardioidaceae bacterium]